MLRRSGGDWEPGHAERRNGVGPGLLPVAAGPAWLVQGPPHCNLGDGTAGTAAARATLGSQHGHNKEWWSSGITVSKLWLKGKERKATFGAKGSLRAK